MNRLPPDQLRDIPKWTRAYATNRTLPALVVMAAWLALFFVASRLFNRAGVAYRAGEMEAFYIQLAAGLFCLAAITSLAIPAVMRRLQRFLFRALYSGEGEVAAAQPAHRRPLVFVVSAGFILGVLALVFLGERIPVQYHQPVSAIFVIPFLILIAPHAGLAGILYPLLYAIHAVLLLAGAPIVFHGEWATLNIVVPIAGYGLLSMVAGHIYNRIALRRLRSLARQS